MILYSTFPSGQSVDIALHVRGSWYGIYRLHSVVLIQAVRTFMVMCEILLTFATEILLLVLQWRLSRGSNQAW